MYPIPCLFYNIKDNWLLAIVVDNLINLSDDMIDIIACNACDRLYLIFDWCIGILFSVLEHQINLIFQLIAFVWFA
jgi:hypothetical protein